MTSNSDEQSCSSSGQTSHVTPVKEEPLEKMARIEKGPIVPKCDAHPVNDCKFWCNTCVLAICWLCVDEDHQTHKFELLKTVIKQKVEKSLKRLNVLMEGMKKVDDNIDQCIKQEIFGNRCIGKSRKIKAGCESIKSIPPIYEKHVESLREFAEGDDSAEVDREVLASVLKLLHKTDRDFFEVENISLIGIYCNSDPNLRGYFCIPKIKVNDDFNFEVCRAFSLSFGCEPPLEITRRASDVHWPLTIDCKYTFIITADKREKVEKFTRVMCDLNFIDKESVHVLPLPDHFFFSNCDAVFEIFVHDN